MGRKRLPPDDPREWISRAKSNLAMSRYADPDVDLEDLCFEAQQAAEKGIKAVFIKRGEHFPFSHDLTRLLRLLELNGLKVPKYVHESRELTQFAHVTRYPGLSGPVNTRTLINGVASFIRQQELTAGAIKCDTINSFSFCIHLDWLNRMVTHRSSR